MTSKELPDRARRIRLAPDRLLTAVDLAATLLFAIEGALAAVAAGADVFGMLVIAFVTALGGGVIRDLILGEHPPAAFRSTAYPLLAAVGGMAVFLLYQGISSVPSWLLNTLDAGGLALFCVAGAQKALDYRTNAVAAVILGITTGVGGGMVRDVLLNTLPAVLHAHIYAVAAGLGAAVLVLAARLGVAKPIAMLAGFVACFVLRVLSFSLDWNLPRVHS